MKNILLFIAAILILLSCNRQLPIEEKDNTFTDWANTFKQYEQVLNLYAGQTIPVGYVVVGMVNQSMIDDGMFESVDYEGQTLFGESYNFSAEGIETGTLFVRYITTDNWWLTETHLHVGDKESIPVTNKKNPNPKIGRFVYSADHNPYVQDYVYFLGSFEEMYHNTFTLDGEPDDGFVVASHAAVVLLNEAGNTIQEETAWSKFGDANADVELSKKFSDSRWGWYNYFFLENSYNLNISQSLYVVEYTDDILNIYIVYPETGFVSLISSQAFAPGVDVDEITGLGWDSENNVFFFTTLPGNELWIQELGDIPPYSLDNSGGFGGEVVAGEFYNGNYYYVDAVTNTIVEVSFDESFHTATITNSQFQSLNDIGIEVVESIAFSPDGNTVYIVGINDAGNREVISLEFSSGVTNSLGEYNDIDMDITVGSDGIIYGVDSDGNLYSIDEDNGIVEEEGDIQEDDGGPNIIPSDIASGPEEEATEVGEE